jgi:hypothetical protein
MEKNAPASLRNRKPAVHQVNPRVPDKDGFMVKVVDLTNAWRKSDRTQSLKEFMRAAAKADDPNAKRWLFNKGANTSKPGKAIGCTRKKKSGPGGKK